MLPLGDGVPSRLGAVAIGSGLAIAGAGIVALSIWGNADAFHGPRWVVGSVGGAFFIFGAWTAVCYAIGYDPNHPDDGLPSPRVQLAICLPGLILFAAPFHWIAFGPGERRFGISILFLTIRGSANAVAGRFIFGVVTIAMDVFIILWTLRTLRQDRARGGGDPSAVVGKR
jgi:hypothetical protein